MRIGGFIFACFICVVGCGLPVPASFFTAGTSAGPGELAYQDAEILIYLLPVAKETRAHGSDVIWERQTSPTLNQSDYFVFCVADARPNPSGSSTIGYFAVNKRNAEVWEWVVGETERNAVTSTEIEGVQKIIRRAHHIDHGTVQKYSLRPIYLGIGSR